MLNCPHSNYYFLTQLNQPLNSTTSKCLLVFHCNIRSLPKSLSLLNKVLHSVNRKPDILAITETRLSNQTVTNVDILNYDFFHTNLKAIHQPDLKFTIPLVKSFWCKITSGKGRPNIIVVCIYWHPVIYMLLLLNLKLCLTR